MKIAQDPSFHSAEDAINGYVTANNGQSAETIEVFIFMGKTGAGKSSMIKLLGGVDNDGNPPNVDGGIESCTIKPVIYKTKLGSQSLLLLDTPGFDDSSRGNLEILREIVSHLYIFALRRPSITVRGIIFLHDIVEVRLGGSQKKTWQILKAIVGEDAMSNVLIGTTQWSDSASRKYQIEAKREEELAREHWKGVGGVVRVAYEDRENSVGMLTTLLGKQPKTLLVQSEMMKPPHIVEGTTAGRVAMPEALVEMERLKKQMEEEKRKNDEEKKKQEEAQRKAAEEQKRKLEEERVKQEEEKRRREEEQKKEQQRREEQRRREEEEQRRRHEEELRKRAEEARKRAEEEARKRHEEEKRKIEEQRRKWEEEQRKREEEERRRQEEQRRRWEEEDRRRKEDERRRQEEIQRQIDQENHRRWEEEQRRHHHHHNNNNGPCVIS